MRTPLTAAGLAFVLAAALAGCGGNGDQRQSQGQSVPMSVGAPARMAPPPPPEAQPPQNLKTFDAQERPAGPNVNPAAAPGVAFNYAYAFRLGAARIAAVQERHASDCERLGPARCRITGMLYRVRSETDIEARLQFALDPAVARGFGRHAAQIVAENEGMLVESQITGTDAGAQIRHAGRSIAELEADLARIERRLAAGGTDRAERERLGYEAQQVRRTLQAARQMREDAA